MESAFVDSSAGGVDYFAVVRSSSGPLAKAALACWGMPLAK